MSGMPTLSVRVARRRVEAESIVSFDLVAAAGDPLPPFEPGAHIDVRVSDDIVRQYSLCSRPGEGHYRIAVLREPGSRGGSSALHERVNEGDVLRIGPPRNLFPLEDGISESILLAGGIGITPILCMAESLERSGRRFRLHYCARSMKGMAFRERIAASSFAASAEFHCDDGQPSQRFDLDVMLRAASRESHIYVCGPAGFMDMVLDGARAAGWPEAALHHECFSPRTPETPGGAFEIELAGSGRVIVVAAGQSAAEALMDAGIDVPVSCEQGICGTCITRVVAGEPDHRDSYLSPSQHAQNAMFTPCCSRSKTPRLVLDL